MEINHQCLLLPLVSKDWLLMILFQTSAFHRGYQIILSPWMVVNWSLMLLNCCWKNWEYLNTCVRHHVIVEYNLSQTVAGVQVGETNLGKVLVLLSTMRRIPNKLPYFISSKKRYWIRLCIRRTFFLYFLSQSRGCVLYMLFFFLSLKMPSNQEKSIPKADISVILLLLCNGVYVKIVHCKNYSLCMHLHHRLTSLSSFPHASSVLSENNWPSSDITWCKVHVKSDLLTPPQGRLIGVKLGQEIH